jgi:hypothetical protein
MTNYKVTTQITFNQETIKNKQVKNFKKNFQIEVNHHHHILKILDLLRKIKNQHRIP